MKVLLFGATGMVGQGVLRGCFLDPDVERVQSVGRSPPASIIPSCVRSCIATYRTTRRSRPNSPVSTPASFPWRLFGRHESRRLQRITYGITMAAAETLCRLNPQMRFFYVSGAGTDSTEQGRSMWARVKGRTENALLRLPFAAAYMFRPGLIAPMHGERPKAAVYQSFYTIAKPLLALLRRTFPNYVLTTEEIGQAMLIVARRGYPKHILEIRDIRAILQTT